MTNTPPPPPPWGGPENRPPAPSWNQPAPGQQPAGPGPSGPSGFPPQPPPGWAQTAPPTPLSASARTWGWITVAIAAVVAVAAFLVWAKFPSLGVEVKGLGGEEPGADGPNDGAVTLTLAITAAILAIVRAFGRWSLAAGIVVTVCGALILIVALADIGDISDTEEQIDVPIDVGVGLWITLVAGLAMTVWGIVGIVKRR